MSASTEMVVPGSVKVTAGRCNPHALLIRIRFAPELMMSRAMTGLALLFICLVSPFRLLAQDVPATPPLRVFLECNFCDFDLVRTEVQYVDWMRDRADADLHVISRQQATGGGGREYALDFTGLRRHAGRADTLYYYSGRDDTQDTTRRGLLRVLTMGLMRYVADTPVANELQIRILPATSTTASQQTTAVRDPWNAWVFTLSGNGSSSGESSRNNTSLRASFGANRTTADWKLSFSSSGNYGRQSNTYTISGRDTTSVNTSESTTISTLVARGLNRHTSVGFRTSTGTSAVNNAKFYTSITPALEYSVFPYSETTRRALLLGYSIGVRANTYREETIYFVTEETRGTHSLSASYRTLARWGQASLSIDGSQYLHDTKLYNVGMYGFASMSLVRGLSLDVSADYSRVRDQITLARRRLTPEEVLLRQRAIATGFTYGASVGISYRFGSAVQNVVNTRLQ